MNVRGDFMIYAMIMSGGLGSRFWPKSRRSLPKQFLKTVGDKTMIESTVERITRIVDRNNIYVVTNSSYVPLIKNLNCINDDNIFREPLNRETATCIGLAAIKLLKRDFEAVMIVLPSDHVIIGEEKFEAAIKAGVEMAKNKDYLVTLGIKAERPEAGYGYIEMGEELEEGVFKVKRFVEKPNIDVARSFVEKGSYLWNSGMFIWRADRLLREFKKYLPDLYRSLMRIYEFIDTSEEEKVIEEEYQNIDGISIDFGVMQRTHRAVVLKTDFIWDDIGSFTSLERFLNKDENGNLVTDCNYEFSDVENSIILGNKRMIAAIGIRDMLIVDTQDVVMICPRDRSQEIKELVKKMSLNEEYERFI